MLIIHGGYVLESHQDPEITNARLLLLGEIQGSVPVSLWSQHTHQAISI